MPIDTTKTRHKGFFIIEVLLAIVILTMVFLTLFSMISFTSNRTERSKFDTQAAGVLQEGVEISRVVVLADWSRYGGGAYYPIFNANTQQWTLRSGSEGVLQGRFSRKIELSSVCRNSQNGTQVTCGTGGTLDQRSKMVTVTVTWREGSVDKEVKAQLLLFLQNS